MQWIEQDNCLTKEFIFSNNTRAKEWLLECQKIGNKINHHVDKAEVNGSMVMLTLATHDAGNIVTNKDWQLAQMLDSEFYGAWGAMKTHLISSSVANGIWKKLFIRQKLNLAGKVSGLFWSGLDSLSLPENSIPNLDQLNKKVLELSNFEMERTKIQYAEDKDWFNFLFKRRILVTDYIRVEEDLDFTPLPDIFHDIFGHLPMLANKPVADLAFKFGQTFKNCETDLQRFMVERLWWNSMEFGFLEEGGKKLILGAGLISSFGECNFAFSEAAKHIKFTNKLLSSLDRSPHNFNRAFLVFESLGQISEALDWILSHPNG